MRKENFNHLECPLARSLNIVGEWWTLLVVRDLFYGITTFDALCRDLGIARNILADRLKKLQKRGVIENKKGTNGQRKTIYRLTQKGKDLFPVIMSLVAWADRWEAPEGPPILFLHGEERHPVHPVVICQNCEKPINATGIIPEMGPGARRPSRLPTPLRPQKDKNRTNMYKKEAKSHENKRQ